MPKPKTKDVNALIKFYRREHPEWDMKQVIAVAMSAAGKSKKGKHGNKQKITNQERQKTAITEEYQD